MVAGAARAGGVGFDQGVAVGLLFALCGAITWLTRARWARLSSAGGPQAAADGRLFPLPRLFAVAAVAVAVGAACAAVWRAEAGRVAETGAPASPPTSGHKPLWPPDGRDAAALVCAAVGLLLAAGGGIGGGGILVPIYILIAGFDDKHAIPLSNLTILGGAVANCLLNWPRRHPDAARGVDRPLIDFDLALAMEPLTIAGATLGAVMNKLLPDVVVTVMLVVVLGLTAHKTLSGAWRSWQKESAGAAVAPAGGEAGAGAGEGGASVLAVTISYGDGEAAPLLRKGAAPLRPPPPLQDELQRWQRSTAIGAAGGGDTEALHRIYYAERDTPWDRVAAFALATVVVVAMKILKGGPQGPMQNPLGVTCGDWLYWLFLLGQVPWCAAVSYVVRGSLLAQNAARKEAGYDWDAMGRPFKWDDTTTVKYPLICSIAGLCAGLFGIGGGIVKGPLMLAMGVAPEVASATSAFMILFTAGSASITFALFGLVVPDYGCFVVVLGFVCTLFGQLTVTALIRRSGRPSLIAWTIGATVALSAVLMGMRGTQETLEGWRAGELWATSPFCDMPVLYHYENG